MIEKQVRRMSCLFLLILENSGELRAVNQQLFDLVIIVGADDRYIFSTAVLNGGAYGRRQVGGDIKAVCRIVF